MVGLSIVLEAQKGSTSVSRRTPQLVLNKVLLTRTIKSPSAPNSKSSPSSTGRTVDPPPATAFLDCCFLCKQKLLPGKDIYMYKGDRAFCSVECRCRQIYMDEEETLKTDNCALAAMRQRPSSRKGARIPANRFAY
ncbi:hypothetical protein RJ639_002731 [Escallonia herrerae]|uniref:FLZ-type domain-containing protein n=1 Tax=Escallonia herrerae TaxID=1293975 RepID=A0AA88W2A0_9ASTE|nr:hypothetical protein RJ639_002731 [Escallonia herrerae]